MKKLIFTILLAAVLWTVMFSPWTAPFVNFWWMMTGSALTLSVFATLFNPGWWREVKWSLPNVLLGIGIAVALWGVFWLGDKVSSWMFDFARPQVDSIYGMKEGESPWLLAALLLLLIGPAEEIFWRGYVQRTLSKRWNPNAGFVVATLIYALVHAGSCNFMLVMAALVVGIVLALVITMIMRSSMLRVKQIQTDYNMGDIFDITNYIEPDSNDARLEYDNSEFAPDKLGKYTIKYKIGRGKLSKTKKTVINVVDEVNPYIDGPDEIDVSMGTDINWSDYYNVTDEDPDVQDSLKASQDVDTSKERTVTVTLTAEDWAGNKASRQITVNVLKSNFDE